MLPSRRDIVAGAMVAAAAGCAQAQGRWEARTKVPWPVQEVYGCRWQGKLLIGGGMAPNQGGTNALARAGLYDPAADRWSEAPPLPFPRHHPVFAPFDSERKALAVGGFRVTEAGTWTAVKDTLVFDNGWTPVAPLPQFQCEAVALGHGGMVHVISGRTPRGADNAAYQHHADTDLHQVYDPREDRWRSARPCPLARNSATGAVIDGKLYLAAGRRIGGGNSGQLDRYDPATDQWVTLRPMPQGAGGCAGAAVGGKLYVFGGEGGPRDNGFGGVIPNCWAYDPATDQWAAQAPMGRPRHGLAAIADGRQIFAVGGGLQQSGGQVSDIVEVFVPA